MTKKIIKLVSTLLTIFLLNGCGSVTSTSGGKADMGYLVLISNGGQYAGKSVNVFIDDKTEFTATVDKDRKFDQKRKTYAIATGSRTVKVIKDGKSIYERILVISPQETKKIILE